MSDVVNEVGLAEGEQLKHAGIGKAASSRKVFLAKAQAIAFSLGIKQEVVTIDQVRAEYQAQGGNWKDLGPAAGAVFKRKIWKMVGFIPSCQPVNHARVNFTWSLIRRETSGETQA